ncbi:MAG: DUF4232 domain-containing protein [Ktedonobacterales bacterium]
MFVPARLAKYGFALTLGIGLVLLGLSSCSSTAGSPPSTPVAQASTPTATASVPTPSDTATGTGATNCQATQLTVAFQSQQSGLSNFANIYSLQNISQQTCTLDGYPGVQLLDASQQPVAVTFSQQTTAYLFNSQNPQLVTLAHGASGYFIVEWDAAINGSGNCPGAAFVLVTPPGDQVSFRIASMVPVCTGSVIVSPIEPTAFGY